MKAKGIVLEPRVYRGTVTPPDSLEDTSRFGNDGVHTNITWVRLPSGLWVRSFNGTSSIVTIADSPSLKFGSGNLTCMAWARLTGATAQRAIINKGIVGGVAAGYWLWANSANPTFYMTDGAIDVEARFVGLDLFDDTFHFWVGTRVGIDAYVYIDGVEIATDTQVGFGSTDTTDDLYIGQRSGGTLFMSGDIASTRVLSYGLTAAKIWSIFQAERRFFGR